LARKDFKFNGQNLTLDLNKMSRLSSSEKASMLGDRSTRSMLSTLTAQQFASTFPEYYKKSLPDVGANLPSVRSLSPLSAASAQSMQQDSARQYRNNERIKPSRGEMASPVPPWLKKVQAESGINVSDPRAVAQLSVERRKLLDDMKKGNISADDPKVAFLKSLSKEDLAKSGIEMVSNGDKQEFRSMPIQVSREEIDTAKKSTITGNNNQEIIMKSFASELKKKGVPAESVPYAVSALSGQVKVESGFNPNSVHDGGTGYGIYGARDEPKPGGSKRRTKMLEWLEQNGFSKDSAEGQARYMVHEAFSGGYNNTKNMLMRANKDNMADVTAALVDEFERPLERVNNKRVRNNHSLSYIDSAKRFAFAEEIPTNATDEQIEAIIKEKKDRGRQQHLADKTVPKLPEGVDPKFAEMFERMSPGQKQRNLEAIAKIGATKFNELYQSASTSPELSRNSNESVEQLAQRISILQPNLKNEQCVNLARQIVGSKESVSTWRKGESVQDGNLKVGTPIATFMDQDTARDSNYYAGGRGKVGKPGADTTHAGVFAGYITDKDGKRIGMKIFEQYSGSGGPKQSTLYFDDDRKRIKNASRYYAINNPQGNLLGEENNPTHIARLEESAKKAEEAKKAEAKKIAATPPEAPTPAAPAQPAQATPAQTTAAAPPTEAIPTIQSFAEGGRGQLGSDEIRAMPIKNIKNDNSVVVDKKDNPIFTMNTKQETANFDPLTRQVSVSPINRTSPEDLITNDNSNNNNNREDYYDNTQNNVANQSQQMQQDNGDYNSFRKDVATSMTNMTSDIFKDPSFKRAVAKTRFVDSGDHSLGGHFGSSNADLS
jgi:hypothetical protein